MTQIEQMIKDMCPNGVEWKTLGEICELVTKQTGFDYSNTIKPALLTKRSEGSIPYMQTRNFSGRNFNYETEYYVPEYIVNQFPRIVLDKKCLLISIVGSIGNVGLFPGDEKCFLGGAICVLKFKPGINISFVYEYMSSIYGQNLLKSKIKGSGQSTITIEDIRNFSIPLPPQEIQERIVLVLEEFAALAAELQAELQAELHLRRKQYEYYRTHLLTPHTEGTSTDKSDDCNWVTSTLGEICENCYAGATPSTSRKDFWENGTIPWMSSGEVHQGHVTSVEKYITELGFQNSSTKWVPEDSVVIALAGQGKTRGCVALTKIRLCTNQSLCALIPKKDLILPEYLYQYLKTQYMQLRNVSAGDGTRGGLNLKMIREFPIVYPSLKEQDRIVELLEKFDKLTMSLEEGIPAEQAAQQKRYEYYRDLLLTFPRKEV